jgi:hypothetical protein
MEGLLFIFSPFVLLVAVAMVAMDVIIVVGAQRSPVHCRF